MMFWILLAVCVILGTARACAEFSTKKEKEPSGVSRPVRGHPSTTSGRAKRHLSVVSSPKVLSKEDLNEMEEWFSEGTRPEDYE
jgi:hypothetical protein